MPTCAAIAAAVRGWSPVITMIRMPALWQRATASATSARGGSRIVTSPRKHSSRSASSRAGGCVAGRAAPARERQHAQALDRRSPRPAAVTSSRSAGSSGCASPSADERGGAARQHRLGRSLGVQPIAAFAAASSVDISLRCGSKLYWWTRRALAAGGVDARRRAPGRGAAARPRSGRRCCCPSGLAGERCCRRRSRPRPSAASDASGCGGRPLAVELASRPPSVQAATGLMRFSVSVPVLSVQITSVEPSVSTALRRLTSAPRRASAADGDGQRERDHGQQALGDVAGQQPDGEHDAVLATTGPRRRSRQERTRPPSRRDRRRSARRPFAPVARAGWAPP